MNRITDRLSHVMRTLAARFHHMLGITHRYLASAYGMVWEYENAIDCFNRAIRLAPGFAQAYLDRGILYWRELDHPRKAIHDLTTALDLDATLVEARFNRGVAHQQLREYAEAIEDFEAYLAVGEHPYWREHAESMIRELSEWVVNVESAS